MFKQASLCRLQALVVTLALFTLSACGAAGAPAAGRPGSSTMPLTSTPASPRLSTTPSGLIPSPATSIAPPPPASSTPGPVREQDLTPAAGEERAIVLDLAQQLWALDRQGARAPLADLSGYPVVAELHHPPARQRLELLAPDGQSIALLRQGRLVVRDLATGREEDRTPAGLAPFYDDALNVDPGARLSELCQLRWAPGSQALLLLVTQEPANGCDAPFQTAPQVYLIDLRAGTSTLLAEALTASWSPRGDQLAYVGPPFSGPYAGQGWAGVLMLATADASQRRQLSQQEAMPEWQPLRWSPDGAWLGVGAALFEVEPGMVHSPLPDDEQVEAGSIQLVGAGGRPLAIWRTRYVSDPLPADEPDVDGQAWAVTELVLLGKHDQPRMLLQTEPGGTSAGMLLRWQFSPPLLSATPQQDVLAVAGVAEQGGALYTLEGALLAELALPVGGQIVALAGWSSDGQRLLADVEVGGRAEVWVFARDGHGWRLGEGVGLGWR